MYRFGKRIKSKKHHLRTLVVLFFILTGSFIALVWYLVLPNDKTEIKQAKPSSAVFDPTNKKQNLRIDTALYTMELPKDWQKTSENKDTRYNSIVWTMQSGGKNRWIEIFTDRLPDEIPYNRIVPITIRTGSIIAEAVSDNCTKFTQHGNHELKVASVWQDAPFSCDFSNYTDNIIGVSEIKGSTKFKLTGINTGTHNYMITYSDRGIPEDISPLNTALNTLIPK